MSVKKQVVVGSALLPFDKSALRDLVLDPDARPGTPGNRIIWSIGGNRPYYCILLWGDKFSWLRPPVICNAYSTSEGSILATTYWNRDDPSIEYIGYIDFSQPGPITFNVMEQINVDGVCTVFPEPDAPSTAIMVFSENGVGYQVDFNFSDRSLTIKKCESGK